MNGFVEKYFRWLLGAAALLLVWLSLYSVRETEFVLVTQFGRPLYTVHEAGLHAKWFFQSATYFDKRTTMNFKTAYRINDRFRVYAEIRNLTDEPVRSYAEMPGLPAFNGPANEYSGVTYVVGLGWSF